jgi:hypothetical protein
MAPLRAGVDVGESVSESMLRRLLRKSRMCCTIKSMATEKLKNCINVLINLILNGLRLNLTLELVDVKLNSENFNPTKKNPKESRKFLAMLFLFSQFLLSRLFLL